MASENRGFVTGKPTLARPQPPQRPQVVTQVRPLNIPPASVSHGGERPKSSPARILPDPAENDATQKQVKKKREFCPTLVPLKFVIFLMYGGK